MLDPETSPLTSTCTCGSILLTLPKPPTAYAPTLCFCQLCAEASSSSYQPNILVPTSDLVISDPKKVLKAYEFDSTDSDSGLRKVKYFCGTCGVFTHSWMEVLGNVTVVKAGGTLGVQRQYLKPVEKAIYVQSMPQYLKLAHTVTTFDGMPPQPRRREPETNTENTVVV